MEDLQSRKANRLSAYDYSQNGGYFVTICTKDGHEMLWENKHYRFPHKFGQEYAGVNTVRPDEIKTLSEYGLVVNDAIQKISKHYPMISVDKYVIMPNHIHLILIICGDNIGRTLFAPTISTVIKQMKGYVTKQIGFSLWQRSFHDRIIRNEQEYQKIWQYIDQNQFKLATNEFYFK